ncbi:MAG: DUF4861 domain-containing protein [Candidatus Symbiothrix sp.]|jgi:hypothetical protein|nr:DUF4861 domain-containing protein [Candidatus Symbiothrix sp.]
MKLTNLVFVFGALFASQCFCQSLSLQVENTLDFNRKGEIVEVELAPLRTVFGRDSYVLQNSDGKEISYQKTIIKGKKCLIFQADVAAKSVAVYTFLKGQPAAATVKTTARFVPERRDDFAWENDIAAWRMYGPALEQIENPSNGIDIWMKYRETPVMDSLYAGDRQGLPYHEDNGLGGFDCYDVGHTLGAGGQALYAYDKIWIGETFDHYHIIETGPLRSSFMLTYDTVKVGDVYYKAVLTITTDAGSILNRASVTYEGIDTYIKIATGIFMHRDSVNTVFDKANKTLAYTKNITTNRGVRKGQTYLGLYVPESDNEPFYANKQFVVLSDYQIGKSFVYYFGGVWNGWKYKTETEWLKALEEFSQTRRTPLKVSFLH